MPDGQDKIKFHYMKGHFFRVIHANGAVASIAPAGDIVISIFSERPPIPQLTVQSLNESGMAGEEILSERVQKDGLVRELEVSLMLRPEVVEGLVQLLQQKLEQFKQLRDEQHDPPRVARSEK
jgi:hypothetical protein